MSHTHSQAQIPYFVQRGIARYAEQYRAQIERAVRKRMAEKNGEPLSPEEIGECAASVIMSSTTMRDERLAVIARREYDAGKSRPFQDYLDELRQRVASAGAPAVG